MNIEVKELQVTKPFDIALYPNTGLFIVDESMMFINQETKEAIYLGNKDMF